MDSFYAVTIAEEASAVLTRQENRHNPQSAIDAVHRLAKQGAEPDEIARIARFNEQKVREILAEAGISAEAHEKAPRRAVDPRDRFPEPRPVIITYTKPRDVPEPVYKIRNRNSNASNLVCPPDHKHEVRTTCYLRHGCRCDPCREWAARRARKKAQRNMTI